MVVRLIGEHSFGGDLVAGRDLAMLALFGCPYYDDIIAGYQRVHPLRTG